MASQLLDHKGFRLILRGFKQPARAYRFRSRQLLCTVLNFLELNSSIYLHYQSKCNRRLGRTKVLAQRLQIFEFHHLFAWNSSFQRDHPNHQQQNLSSSSNVINTRNFHVFLVRNSVSSQTELLPDLGARLQCKLFISSKFPFFKFTNPVNFSSSHSQKL